MNIEDFVTFEQAAGLRKLGFMEEGFFHYDCSNQDDVIPNNDISHLAVSINDFKTSYNSIELYDEICYDAPTLAQAQKWLREIKSLHITPWCLSANTWGYFVKNLKTDEDIELDNDEGFISPSYEEALSAGITECLKLLEKERLI